MKKQKFEFPKQGVGSSASSGLSSSTSNVSITRIVDLDTSWQNTTKDVSFNAKDFKANLSANREKGKSGKLLCSVIKQLLSVENYANTGNFI